MSSATDINMSSGDEAGTQGFSLRYKVILRRIARLRVVRWVALASVLAFWIATQTAIQKVEANLESLDDQMLRDPYWAISQLNVETNRFLVALSLFRTGDATRDEVNQRFDILWSRNSTISDEMLAEADKALGVDLDAQVFLGALLELHERDILSIDELSEQGIWTITEDFLEAREKLHVLAVEMLHSRASLKDERRKQLSSFLDSAGQMGNLLLVFLLFLIFVFAVDSARLRLLLGSNVELLKASRSASEAKSQFISVVSHELRTPLTSINGSIKLLLGGGAGKLDDAARDLLTIANRNAVQLGRIIDDLLDIEKLEQGGASLNLERLDLSSLAEHVVTTVEPLARQREVRLSSSIEKGVLLTGDSSRLSRVLTNLLSNAIKFTEAGGKVTLALHSVDDRIVIDVSDTGIGIPPEHLDRVFDRFHQVDGTDRRKLGGAGLGLSIARTIVDMHGGTIEVQSVLGKGSVFCVELPVKVEKN